MVLTIKTLVGLVLAVNGFDYHNDLENSLPFNMIVMGVFLVLLIVAGVVMFLAAYNERKKLALAAMGLGIVVLLVWLVLAALSFANKPTVLRHICVHERCPESLWLVDLKYRGNWRNLCDISEVSGGDQVGSGGGGGGGGTYSQKGEGANEEKWPFEEWKKMMRRPTKTSEEPIQSAVTTETTPAHTTTAQASEGSRRKLCFVQFEGEGAVLSGSGTNEKDPEYVIGLPLAGAVLLPIVYFVLFAFTIFTMWSYYKELSYFVPVPETSNYT